MSSRDTATSTPDIPGASGTARTPVRIADALPRLREAVAAAARRSRELGRPVLAWTRVRIPPIDPLEFVERSTARERTLWARPDDRLCLAGAGAAWLFEASGGDRFARAEAAWGSVLDHAVGAPEAAGRILPRGAAPWGAEPAAAFAGPIAFFGFAFAAAAGTSRGPAAGAGPSTGWIGQPWAGYPDALLLIPRVVVGRSGDEQWVTLSAMTDDSGRLADGVYEQALAVLTPAEGTCAPAEAPHRDAVCAGTAAPRVPAPLSVAGEFPPAERWKRSVRDTARAVAEGRLQKAVLARGIHVRGPRRLDPAAALRSLGADYPACTLFAVARHDRWFLGATPERLVRVQHGEAAVAAVAGTAKRGRTAEEDRRLGAMLLASKKNRLEHAIVVQALREGLAGLCTEIDPEDAPRLMTVRNAHHLHTPLRFALRDRQSVLALTGRLHPTPAVGGAPAGEALRWIRNHERWDRGWYAGPVGWVGPTGEGESAVGIRSALLHDSDALLFAGCGIVADSDADQEYAESELKFRPVSAALAAAADPDRRAARRGENR